MLILLLNKEPQSVEAKSFNTITEYWNDYTALVKHFALATIIFQ